MFVEWYDEITGKWNLSYLSILKGVIVCLSGFGKWVPKKRIIFED